MGLLLYLFGNHLGPASARFEAMNQCWSLGNSFEDAAAEVGGVSENEVESAEQVHLLKYMYELAVVVFELIMLQILQIVRWC